jgi:N-acetylmuramic acid 6-phosphate etherase
MKDLETEKRNCSSMNLDSLSIGDILSLMNSEDKQIPFQIEKCIHEIEKVVELVIASLSNKGRVIYIGAGTSGRLGVVDAVETVPTFNVPKGLFTALMAGGNDAMFQAVEKAEDKEEEAIRMLKEIGFNSNDILIGISASGHTPFVKGGFKYSQIIKSKSVLICNVSNPELGDFCDISINAVTGPEVLTGSTRLKAGTADKIILNMISTASMVKMGKVYENLMVDVVTTNEKLKYRAISIVCEATNADEEIAKEKLKESKWNAKNAIVQILLDVNATEADILLKKENGFIRRVIKNK